MTVDNWRLPTTDEAFAELKRVCEGYTTKGMPSSAVSTHQWMQPYSPTITVKLKLDGYQVEFPHDESFEVPPPSQWVKQPL